jgi:hypothetical protein
LHDDDPAPASAGTPSDRDRTHLKSDRGLAFLFEHGRDGHNDKMFRNAHGY